MVLKDLCFLKKQLHVTLNEIDEIEMCSWESFYSFIFYFHV